VFFLGGWGDGEGVGGPGGAGAGADGGVKLRRMSGAGAMLDLCQTAVDEQLNTGHVTAVVGREEKNSFRYFVCSAGPAQRDVDGGSLHELIDLFVRHPQADVVTRRGNDAGTDRVDSNLAILQINRQVRAKERTAALVAL
jgi:hypothetical protein